ncbi:hypothetical protein NSA36_14885 [Anaerotruncus colihominis]|nr:hypothetical protein [Anaerotruncus colihominis]
MISTRFFEKSLANNFPAFLKKSLSKKLHTFFEKKVCQKTLVGCATNSGAGFRHCWNGKNKDRQRLYMEPLSVFIFNTNQRK